MGGGRERKRCAIVQLMTGFYVVYSKLNFSQAQLNCWILVCTAISTFQIQVCPQVCAHVASSQCYDVMCLISCCMTINSVLRDVKVTHSHERITYDVNVVQGQERITYNDVRWGSWHQKQGVLLQAWHEPIGNSLGLQLLAKIGSTCVKTLEWKRNSLAKTLRACQYMTRSHWRPAFDRHVLRADLAAKEQFLLLPKF